MEKVEIVLGFACNNRCLFCSIGEREGAKSTELAKQEILQALEKDGTKEINFTGGEPTIRKDIFELIAFSRENCAERVRVTTNGRMFSDEKFAEKMKDAGLTGAIFSVHASDAETHDFLSSVKGAFEQTVRGLSNAKKLGLLIDVNTVINTESVGQLPALAEMLARDYDVRFMCIIFPDIDGLLEENKWLVPEMEKAAWQIDAAIDALKRHGKDAWVLNFPPCLLEKNWQDALCGGLHTKMYWFENAVDLDSQMKKGRKKFRECENCSAEEKCQGVPKKYIELKGMPKIKAIG